MENTNFIKKCRRCGAVQSDAYNGICEKCGGELLTISPDDPRGAVSGRDLFLCLALLLIPVFSGPVSGGLIDFSLACLKKEGARFFVCAAVGTVLGVLWRLWGGDLTNSPFLS